MLVAGAAHGLPKTWWGEGGGGGAGRLGNDGGDVALAFQHVAQVGSAGHAAAREVGARPSVTVAVGAAEAGERGDVLGSRQQRADRAGAEHLLAAEAGGGESGAVKGVPERHGLEASRGGAGEF